MEMKEMLDEVFQAARSGEAGRLKKMLELHPQLVHSENAEGMTLLGYAAHFGSPEAVQALLDYGAEVNALSHSKVAYIPSNTALHAALVGQRSLDVIRMLLEHGANPEIRDSNGHTSLHTAAFHDNNAEIIRLLLQHGANVNTTDKEGETALSHASKQNNARVAALLREYGSAV